MKITWQREMDTLQRDITLTWKTLLPFSLMATLKRKNLLPVGANSSLMLCKISDTKILVGRQLPVCESCLPMQDGSKTFQVYQFILFKIDTNIYIYYSSLNSESLLKGLKNYKTSQLHSLCSV